MRSLAITAQVDTDFATWVIANLPADIDGFLRGVMRYRAEDNEVVRTPQFMLDQLRADGFMEGDCDDISTLYAAILLALGYRSVRFVAIRYDENVTEFQHVFVEYLDPMRWWRRLDPTVAIGTIHRELERMVENV